MKKIWIPILLVFLAIFIAVGCVAYNRRGLISSLVMATKLDSDEIVTRIDTSNDKLKNSISEYLDNELRDFSEEEQIAIKSGKTTTEEVLAKIIEEAPKKPVASADSIVQKYSSRLLKLEGKYIGSIEGLLNSAIAEYYELPPEKQGYGGKVRVMQKYDDKIMGLEAGCDAEVESIIASLKSELEAIGASTEIVNTIRETYSAEKELKKAYYINKYM